MLTSTTTQTNLLTTKILIVDDHCDMRQMMKFYLRDYNAEFVECCDGCDALDAYREFQPDWVLMDWEMKKTDGLTASREIIKNFPAARIIIVTQHDDNEMRAEALEAGARSFVLKDDLLALRLFLTRQQYAPATYIPPPACEQLADPTVKKIRF